MNPAPAFRLAACLGLTVLAACTVGPDYVRPTATIPAGFKEAEGWKPAQPAEAASGEPWWSVYSDAGLDAFERQVNVSNQTLKADEAAYREAEAIVAEARAGYFPAVDLTGSALRSGSGGGSSSGKSSLSTGSGSSSNRASVQNSFAATAGASWAPDIWGLIRRTVESDVAIAQASAADLAAAQLSTQITLAIDYIQLRIADETKQLLDDTATDYGRTLQITENKYNAGTAARTDVVTAQAQLENTQSQAIAIGVPRAQYEHHGRPRRQGAVGRVDRARQARRRDTSGAGGTALDLVGTQSDDCRGRALDGVGECQDRHRGGGVFSVGRSRSVLWPNELGAAHVVLGGEQPVVLRSD